MGSLQDISSGQASDTEVAGSAAPAGDPELAVHSRTLRNGLISLAVFLLLVGRC